MAIITYEQAGITYEQASYTYDGFLLADAVTVLSGTMVQLNTGNTGLLNQTLDVSVNTDLDQLGTLQGSFYDVDPGIDTDLYVYIGTTANYLYKGTIRSEDVTEKRGSHKVVKVGAQDGGGDGASPTSAPWGLSDTPNGTTTFGYNTLTKSIRTTEGVSKTTYTATLDKDGLWKNMNIPVTSAIHGLAATVFTIVELQVQWMDKDVGHYVLTLGAPVLTLQDLIQSQASEVTPTTLQNVPATVTVNAAGLQVTNGSITVTNPSSTVIIDGTSNMFKILASGTFTIDMPASTMGLANEISLSGLGTFAETPAFLCWITPGVSQTSRRQMGPYVQEAGSVKFAASASGGSPTSPSGTFDYAVRPYTILDAGGFLTFRWEASNATGGAATQFGRYYILKEIAF